MARTTHVRLLSTISGLLLIGANIGAVPPPTTPPATPAVASFTADVPTIEAEGSSISARDLKAIFAGDIAGHADELAHLNATRIHVPRINVHFRSTQAGTEPVDYVYKDLDFDSISNGVAKSVTMGSADGTGVNGTRVAFGKATAQEFDIGGLLAFYGLVAGSPSQPLKTMYKSFEAAGVTVTGKDYRCSIGTLASGEFKARPLKLSFAELMTLVGSPEFKPGGKPSPEAVGKLLGFYIDFFDAFQTAPTTVQSLDCVGKDEKGKALAVSVGPMTIGGFGGRRYPAIEVKNLKIAGSDGEVSLDDFLFKSFDLSGPFKVLEGAAGNLTEAWFTTHARQLIPAFEGVSLSNLKVDVPDEQHPGQRTRATVGDFDLSLADYVAGVPTTISSSSHHVVVDVPPAEQDIVDQFAGLRQLGISKLDLGFDLALHRDAAAKTLIIDKLGLSGVQLGSVTLGTTLGNVDDALFTGDKDSAMAAAMALTVKSAKLEVVDAGLADIALARAGGAKGTDLATTRSQMSGMAQGIVLVGLGGTPAAKALGDAVGKFIAGDKTLTVTATAKATGGVTLNQIAAAKTDPKTLDDVVSIEAVAE